jgi:hypothetical protein
LIISSALVSPQADLAAMQPSSITTVLLHIPETSADSDYLPILYSLFCGKGRFLEYLIVLIPGLQ